MRVSTEQQAGRSSAAGPSRNPVGQRPWEPLAIVLACAGNYFCPTALAAGLPACWSEQQWHEGVAWQLTVTQAQELSVLERMVLASHEAYAWLENRVHGVGRVMLGVQPQRPRESVPVLRSEQGTVFSGLQTGYLTCMTPSFPVLLTGVGNSEMNRPSYHLPIFISKPHTQPMEGPKQPSGAACVNAFREQCPPTDNGQD